NCQRRAQDGRQAHERGLDVEGRQLAAFGDELVHAGQSSEEPKEDAGTLQHDSAAALLHALGIARELDGVTESLFTPEKDRAALQMRAVPARLPEGSRLGGLPLPAPFVLGPAALVVTS